MHRNREKAAVPAQKYGGHGRNGENGKGLTTPNAHTNTQEKKTMELTRAEWPTKVRKDRKSGLWWN
jgi:hypothetical protein